MKMIVISIGFIGLLVGGVGGYWFGSNADLNQLASVKTEPAVLYYRNPMNPAITSPVAAKDEMGMDYIPVYAETEKPKSREVLYYRNPMNPAITSPVFAKDEMGMDYIPVYANDGGGGDAPAGTVSIDPVTVQNIGVRTALAEQRMIARRLDVIGRIAFNEEKLARLHPKTSGWLEKLMVDETGVQVKQDARLLSIYSPDLVAAQREYLVALSNWEAINKVASSLVKRTTKTLLDSARERLELLDVPAHQLNELQEHRRIRKELHIHSPFAGTVMHIGAREGQYVTPKDQLYLIADLQQVWVYADIYEDDLPWVKVGDAVQMRVRAAPGKIFKGNVEFIYPYLEDKTRTIRVRLSFDNPNLILKPGMFANLVLHTDPQPQAIVVPSESIVRSGSREQVFLVREPGKFEPREVTLGLSADGFTQVLTGVNAGDEVVTSALFLIDSESKLREATAKMMEAMQTDTGQVAGDRDMSDMSMDDMSMDDLSMDDMDMSNMKSLQ